MYVLMFFSTRTPTFQVASDFFETNQGAPKAREVNLVRDPYFQVTLLASGQYRSRFVHIIWTIDSTSLLVVLIVNTSLGYLLVW